MSTPLDRLKEAFPESKGWKVELVRGGLGWMARAGTESVMVDSGFKQDWYHPVVVRYEADTPDAAVDACIAKAREVGIAIASDLWTEAEVAEMRACGAEMWADICEAGRVDAEANADRLAEALRAYKTCRCNTMGEPMCDACEALAAHDARRGKA